MDKPKLIEGGRAFDDRGSVSFINGFDFKDVKRFYQVYNYQPNFIRAWHGHRKEGKYVTVAAGAAVIGAVLLDVLFENKLPEPHEQVRHVLTANKPAVLWIPPGWANGAMSLLPDTLITYYSTASLDETVGDDFRFSPYQVNMWEVEKR